MSVTFPVTQGRFYLEKIFYSPTSLQVPGLAENRPSVLKGDALFVRPSDGSSGNKEYQGFVHRVEMEQVGRRTLKQQIMRT